MDASDSLSESLSSPPPYRRNPSPSLFLAETRTTRTEVVTTTTTTHTFSLPYWKKRNAAKLPISEHEVQPTSPPKSRTPTLLIDKALPPTPPLDSKDPNPPVVYSEPESFQHESPQAHCKLTTVPQSTIALAHAALGIGLPHASTSFSRPETNTIPFTSLYSPRTPSGSSPRPSTSPGLRRSKSSHRVQPREISENHEHVDSMESQVLERRRRGLSFGATSFLNVNHNSDVQGKGKTPDSPLPQSESPKSSAKPLTRRSSFWNRKKNTQATESSVESTLVLRDSAVLPPLPPVLHVSPFNISSFSDVNQSVNTATTTHAIQLSRSQSEGSQPLEITMNSTSESDLLGPTPPIPCTNPPQDSQSTGKITLSGEAPPLAYRPRRQASTPLLHRLSMGVFSSGESSPSSSIPSNNNSHFGFRSPSHHHPSPHKTDSPIPKPLFGQEESPEVYLARLKAAVSKAEVAGILASSVDPFYASALKAYINQFDFCDVPLDIALRKLLMEVGLPRETQQIDRVMEAFAARYMQCNANIFTSEDHPYILAFSLIMLHTDTFNPSNRRKMSKVDYIKNTKIPGIPVEILDCFYDNVVFAPFIFIEDPVDFNGQLGSFPDVSRSATVNSPSSAISLNTPAPFRISNKIDPYYLIINNLLGPLRVDVNSYVPLENPYSYEGTDGSWDEAELHRAFVDANVLEVDVPGVNKMPLFNPSGKSNSFDTVEDNRLADSLGRNSTSWSLKITKIGLLNKKDDISPGGRKSSNRKWKTWSVILTGSQLLFFRDTAWVAALSHPTDSMDQNAIPPPPPNSVFKPDESFSVKDAIAVYDHSYTKYKHTMRFVLPDGRQLLLQAGNDKDLDEWISRINYASAFKSAGVRIRPPGLSGEDVLLTGVAAATSHLHDMQKRSNTIHQRSWDSTAPNVLMDMLSGPPSSRPPARRRVTMVGGSTDFNGDVPVAPEIDGAEQFKATFDQVKADLAAASWSSLEDSTGIASGLVTDKDKVDSPLGSFHSSNSTNSRFPTRSQIIQSKIRYLDDKLSASQSQLDSDMRFIHNLSILTPFQKSTRSRLSATVQNIAKRIAHVRLEIEKLKCHRDILRADLTSEDRSWNDSKETALRVAKETLQSKYPKMTLLLDGVGVPSSPEDSTRFPKTPTSSRPESSSGSFHSAMESGFEWPSSDDVAFLTTNYEAPSNGSTSSFVSISGDPNHRSLSSLSSHSHHITTEQEAAKPSPLLDAEVDDLAEDWNKTRGAKRVSLIHVPADIRISSRFQKPPNS